MESWTRGVIKNRKKIITAWIVLLILGGLGAANVGKLLSNRFSVPGSDAERGLDLLKERFNERGDGAFTLVLRTKRPLENSEAADKTTDVRDATSEIAGVTTYLSGYPAINHDTQKIYNDDLARGESIAIPIALIVLAFMFGTLVAIGVPFVFALVTIPATLGAVWIVAHFMDMAIYVTNIVTLIGFAIAIDYSMLVVFRFREELAHTESVEEALVTTMKTAGRATLFSGATVAIG